MSGVTNVLNIQSDKIISGQYEFSFVNNSTNDENRKNISGYLSFLFNDVVYLEFTDGVENIVTHLQNVKNHDSTKTVKTEGSTYFRLPRVAPVWIMNVLAYEILNSSFTLLDNGNIDITMTLNSHYFDWALPTIKATGTPSAVRTMKPTTLPELISAPAAPSTIPALRDNGVIKVGPASFPVVQTINRIIGKYDIENIVQLAVQTGSDICELWTSQWQNLSSEKLESLKTYADAHNVKITGALSDIDSPNTRSDNQLGAFESKLYKNGEHKSFVMATYDETQRTQIMKLSMDEIKIAHLLGLDYIRFNANTDISSDSIVADVNVRNEVISLAADVFKKLCIWSRSQGHTLKIVLENHSTMTYSSSLMIQIFNEVNEPNFALLADNNNWGSVNPDGTRGPFNVNPQTEYITILPYTHVLCGKFVGRLNAEGEAYVPRSLSNETSETGKLFDWSVVLQAHKDIITNNTSQVSGGPLSYILVEPEYEFIDEDNFDTQVARYQEPITYLRDIISNLA